MGVILNIDTATGTAQVNFAKDGIVLNALSNDLQKDHAAFLQIAVEELVAKTGIQLKDIDAVAVTYGPGSYTGLRVGLASAKGLCYALKKPLITINTLEALTVSVQETLQNNSANEALLFCPMIDARRMEVFTAIYNKPLKLFLQPCAMVLDERSFNKELENGSILFFGSGALKWKNICTHLSASFADISGVSAPGIAALSYRYFLQKEFAELAYSEPLYLKEFQDFPPKK
jgi:tRNA threonylcarbamoyladenosine biosynthesis protein TsaB